MIVENLEKGKAIKINNQVDCKVERGKNSIMLSASLVKNVVYTSSIVCNHLLLLMEILALERREEKHYRSTEGSGNLIVTCSICY